ncbi:MAG: hypothetical protein H3C35_02670 [Bacteroidetes bacterium]|nr:hypothetical protein [Bacteroidota bacterium]
MKFSFEHHSQPLLPVHLFVRRILLSLVLGLGVIGISLYIGMAGYHWFENLSWIDAFLNASMLLSGMGPLEQPQTEAGKVFAGMYALYSGLAVILIAGIIFGPVFHRFLHKFHIEAKEDSD